MNAPSVYGKYDGVLAVRRGSAGLAGTLHGLLRRHWPLPQLPFLKDPSGRASSRSPPRPVRADFTIIRELVIRSPTRTREETEGPPCPPAGRVQNCAPPPWSGSAQPEACLRGES